MTLARSTRPPQYGEPMMDLIRRLYPICRSITGDGVRETLRALHDWLPLSVTEVPSGTAVFDWTVPREWNIRDAWIADSTGSRIVNFRDSNLHVVNYSVPFEGTVSRGTLEEHLYSLPDQPDLVPYRTSYYAENWGFCVSERQRQSLRDEQYHVYIDASLEDGSLTYAEAFFPGAEPDEIVFYTHTCHPSLCNDNLTGLAVMAALGKWLGAQESHRFNYRLIFGPGTIGSIAWLSLNRDRLTRIRQGLVVGLLGNDAPHTYKRTRDGNAVIDRIVEYVLGRKSSGHRIIDFSPYGYDERQFGSPGIALPVGRLTRSVNAGYPEYHTSADNLDLVAPERLQESLELVCEIVEVLEKNVTYVNLAPFGEPQLGRRGLYRKTGGTDVPERESAMLWILNQSDGRHSLLDIAVRSGLDMHVLAATAGELESAGLLGKQSHGGAE